MKKKNCVALMKLSYASKSAAAQWQKGRVTLEEKNKAEETRKRPENVKKRKTGQRKFHPGKDTGYKTVELSSLKDSD